ncbi:MAG: DUF3616 domain-containing protein [Verrucomicrobia subdivision 3 bacterium]|nr:DUF3616 domain-containing protein [Limisphaerales bacterium]
MDGTKLVFCGVISWLTWLAPAAAEPVSTQTVYYGMCDASGAVALNNSLFAVANDEDNALRVYDAAKGGLPVSSQDLSRLLRVDPKKPETDLEAACWMGERIFWISSHGRNRDGKFRASRHRFFATRVEEKSGRIQLAPVGRTFTTLLAELLRDARLRPFRLDIASRLPPKAAGGLNIEGLCPTPEGALLLAFRNPIPRGRALIVPLLNPDEVIGGKPPRLGDPLLLDLGGRGVRDIVRWRNRYLILAGAHDGRENTRLFEWQGGSTAPTEVIAVKFKDFNPEAIIVYPDDNRPFQLLSDDGTLMTQGVPCKELKQANQRKFRAAWVELDR